MPGLTMVRSWHTRDFLFVILAFLFVFLPPIYNFNLIDPYNGMPSNALALTPYEQSLNDNLELEESLQYRGHPGGVDLYNAMPSNALELTPYEQALNNNLELGESLQYRGHPGGVDPYNGMSSNALELSHYEQSLNDNLELGGSPQYRGHPGGVYPYNVMPSNALELNPYEQSLNDNLELGRSLQYTDHPGGDHTVNASPESAFLHNMYPPPVQHEANYRSPYVEYRPASVLSRPVWRRRSVHPHWLQRARSPYPPLGAHDVRGYRPKHRYRPNPFFPQLPFPGYEKRPRFPARYEKHPGFPDKYEKHPGFPARYENRNGFPSGKWWDD